MIAYLRGEPGADVVSGHLLEPANQCVAHAINMCEVYYDFYRTGGGLAADEAVRDLKAVGIRIRDNLSPSFWQAAGELKALQRRISLADCFAVTLARTLGGTVLTCDHHEFDPLAEQSICTVVFIR